MEEVIRVRHMRKSLGGKLIHVDVSFSLMRHESIVLLGKSGSGKSVLMKTIVGLIDPEADELKVLGLNVADLNEDQLTALRRKVGYVFQEGALYDSMTVGENITFSLSRQGRKRGKEIEQAMKTSLERVSLLDAIDKMPSELSGGMRKRVALARTLVLEPEVILYDEPTAGLDPVTSKEIIHLILEMKYKYGISSIIATHDMICAKMTSDRVLILHEGRIGAEGTYDMLENSEVDWISSFFK